MHYPSPVRFRRLDNSTLRATNESIVLNLIRERQPISRAALVRATGLRPSTVTSIVREFIGESLVRESGFEASSGGRRSQLLCLDGGSSVVVGVHVGVRQTAIALSDLTGHITEKKVLRTEREAESFLCALADEITNMLGAHLAPGMTCDGVGVAVPGVTDPEKGNLVYSANLEWRNIPVRDILAQKIDRRILIQEECRAAGLAEIWYGTLKNLTFRHMVCVSVNEGVGTGIFIGGDLFAGASQGSGQFGHVSLDPNGAPCKCGNRGCWEVYTSDVATAARYLDYKCGSANGTAAELDIAEIICRAHRGDELALKALQETGTYLGKGLAIIVNALNPEMIVVAGRIAGAWKIMESHILAALREAALSTNLEATRLMPTRFRENSCLLGAISLVLSQRFLLPQFV